jgi:hypothetical protein
VQRLRGELRPLRTRARRRRRGDFSLTHATFAFVVGPPGTQARDYTAQRPERDSLF